MQWTVLNLQRIEMIQIQMIEIPVILNYTCLLLFKQTQSYMCNCVNTKGINKCFITTNKKTTCYLYTCYSIQQLVNGEYVYSVAGFWQAWH